MLGKKSVASTKVVALGWRKEDLTPKEAAAVPGDNLGRQSGTQQVSTLRTEALHYGRGAAFYQCLFVHLQMNT